MHFIEISTFYWIFRFSLQDLHKKADKCWAWATCDCLWATDWAGISTSISRISLVHEQPEKYKFRRYNN